VLFLLIALAVCALALRLLYVMNRGFLTNWDSATYLMLAETLLNGQGYREWPGAPIHTWFQPLYPIFVALASQWIGDVELSGYLVAALFGSAIVFPIYLLAERLYSPRVALIATILVLFNYRLVDASSSVLTEMPYTFFWLWGVYFTLRVIEEPSDSLLLPVLMGCTLGAAALLRTEGFLYFVFLIGILAGVTVLRWVRRGFVSITTLRGAAVVAGAFLLVFGPYVYFLSDTLGYFAVIGRERTILVIMDASRETYAFHDANSFRFVLDQPVYALKRILHNLDYIVRRHGVWAFPPILIALMALSFFARPWQRGRLWREAFLVAVFLFPWLTAYGVTGAQTRYYYAFVALALVWVANGIDALPNWYTASFGRQSDDQSSERRRYWLVAGTAIFAVFLSYFQQLARPLLVGHFPIHAQERKDQAIADWIRKDGRPSPGIMSASPLIAYYARGRYYGDNNQQLTADKLHPFLVHHAIDYVVADNFFVNQWFPKLAFLADAANAPSYLTLGTKIQYVYDDGAAGYANVYRVDRSGQIN
jgi:4-amino-4-deoxy-L-arabinose transferase-like glycosyltransferase